MISVFDRGFLFGESVYETVSTFGGRPFALAEHLHRLERSAGRVGIAFPPRQEIESAIARTLAEAGNAESRVRVVLTAGGPARALGGPVAAGEPPGAEMAGTAAKSGVADSFDPLPDAQGPPRLIVIVQPLQAPPPEAYRDGVAVEIVSVTRNIASAIDPAIKSGNYLNNILAVREARRRRPGVHEAILCSADGWVAEGATSNVFAVTKAGVLMTPSLDVGILDGVTRAKVLQLARHAGIPVEEGRFTAQQLRDASEVFITSAARGVLPATSVDGQAVGDGSPGAITRRLMDLYVELLRGGRD